MYSILARLFKTKTRATSRTSYLKTLNPTSMSVPFSAQITHIADPKGAQTTDHPIGPQKKKLSAWPRVENQESTRKKGIAWRGAPKPQDRGGEHSLPRPYWC